MRKTVLLAFALAIAGCGGSPSGKLSGKVSVTGGTGLSAGNLTVTAIGPNGGGALTDGSGSYEIDGLADGNYSVSAVLTGTNEGEVRVFATVKGGKGTAPELKFTGLTPPPAPQVGVVSGKASYSDGSDASGITLTLTGPGSQGLAAMADGTFTFNNVAPGTYTLAADAADSLEHRLTVAVQVTGGMTTNVPNLTLTAVGTVTGKATKGSSATGNAGITVAVAGTSARATTADDGSYTLNAVPAGTQTLLATLPDYDPATAMVTVTRGSTMAMDLTISKLTTHGSVSGTVLFADQQDRSIISVSAEGTGLSTHADGNGNYTLSLPAGHFNIVADAPNFPTRPIGPVAVDDGTQVTLPTLVMSPWFDFGAEPGVTAGPTLVATKDGDHALYTLTFGTTPQYRMIDLRTGAVHIFLTGAVGPGGGPIVTSPHGHYVAIYAGGGWLVFDTQTSAFNAFLAATTPPPGNIASFTSDEKFFIAADGAKIHRFEVATGIDTPITAVAGTDFFNDSFLVRDVATAPYALSYAGATGTPTSVATGVTKHTSFVSGQTVIWNNCSSSCAVHLLDQATGVVANPSGAFASTLTANTAVGSGAWIEFKGTGGGFMNVASTNFTVTPLNFGSYAFNPSGTSVLYEITGAPNVLHLEAGAPTGAGTTVGNSTGSFGVGVAGNSAWLDDNRAIAFGNTPLTRYNILNGAVTTDTDLVSTGTVVPPTALWQRSSDKDWVYADREYADLAVFYMLSGPTGFCESLDGKTFFAAGQSIIGAAYQSTIIRTNATGAVNTVSGMAVVEGGLCSGTTAAIAASLNSDELLVATGQTIWHTLNHNPGARVKSSTLGVTQLFGTQTGAVAYPSLMVLP